MAKTTKPTPKLRTIDAVSLEAGKMPPHSPEFEKAVLGALMLDKEAIVEVQELLKSETFHNELHAKIFRAIQDINSRHEPVDMLTVAEELKKKGELDEIGGHYYLSQLTMAVSSAAHVEYHAKLLAQKYIQRQLITASAEIQRDAFDEDVVVDELLDGAQQKIFEIAEGNIHRETEHIGAVVTKAIKELEAAQLRDDGLSGVPSGFSGIDRITLGWQAADMVIVAARPSMGKTAFVLSMARNMSVEHKVPTAFFSLEMPSVQLVKRLMMSESGIASNKIRGGTKLAPHEWTQIETSIRNLVEAPLFIDDTPALSIFEFRSKARRLVLSHNIKIIIIDYLQLMTGPPETQKSIREQEVSAISRALKSIAKELNVPIIALSQLNRSVETRGGNKRPQLSDLRESGAIEQDADLVLFIHRPEYYGINEDERHGSTKGLAEIIIAKHRNGETGDVNLHFSQAKFTDWQESIGADNVTYQTNVTTTIPSKMNKPNYTKMDQPGYSTEFELPQPGGTAEF
ncbi:MAG: replicative DNA helicase [Prevotellaceae bacterium]|jgi:replicative DNA helicase|nr:replicative DNA helicase [Prevotellaceae bacterium]